MLWPSPMSFAYGLEQWCKLLASPCKTWCCISFCKVESSERMVQLLFSNMWLFFKQTQHSLQVAEQKGSIWSADWLRLQGFMFTMRKEAGIALCQSGRLVLRVHDAKLLSEKGCTNKSLFTHIWSSQRMPLWERCNSFHMLINLKLTRDRGTVLHARAYS